MESGTTAGEHKFSVSRGVLGALGAPPTLILADVHPAGGHRASQPLITSSGRGPGRCSGRPAGGGKKQVQLLGAELALTGLRADVLLKSRECRLVPIRQQSG